MKLADCPTPDLLLVRYWSKVDKRGPDECWPWRGSLHHNGHGQFGISQRVVKAHRVAWMLAHGEVPDGVPIRHSSPDLICQNSAHLYRTTQGEQIRRRNPARRRPAPQPPPRAPLVKRLTEEQVREARRLRDGGVTQAEIARRLGFSEATISRAVRGETHRRVPLGERRGREGLTEEDAREVRRLCAVGTDGRDLAARYGVHYSTIRRAATGATWRGLRGE